MPLPGNLSLAEVHMAPLSNQQFAAYVGIDWADTKHDICLQAAGDFRREFDCIPHQVARIDEWAKSLQQRFGGPVAVALELARGPIVAALQKRAEEHTSELQSHLNLVCRLLLEKKKKIKTQKGLF